MTTPHRAHFSLPPDLHYLNCAYMAPLPRAVEAAGIRGMRRKRDPSRLLPDEFFDTSDRLRGAFAGLLDRRRVATEAEPGMDARVDPTRVAILPSVSYGVAITARNAKLGEGDEIILARDQFPGNVYGWMRAATDAGARIRFVDPPEGEVSRGPAPGRGRAWNERFLDAIGPKTRVVSLGHVHWTDGTRFDLAAIGARCRDVGAHLVVDGTQSIGALPFPIDQVRPDAVITAGYKWLLGPYSIALGWFGPAFDDGVPLEESWIARAGSRDFGKLVHYRDEYEPGAVRYDVGERSNLILVPMLLEALERIDAWGGPEAVTAHGRRISASFLSWARSGGLGVDDDGAFADHLFGVALPAGVSPADTARVLAERRIAVSVRGAALRISPHLYNDEGDLDALRSALTSILRG